MGGQRSCTKVSLKHASLWAEIFKKLTVKGLQMEMILGERGVVVGGQRSCAKRVSGLVSNMLVVGGNFQEIDSEGVADGDDPGGKGGSRGWTEVVYEACFRVSLKHASLRAEIFRKLRLKGLQMEMILGERGVVVGGQRPRTKHVSGLVSNMLCCGRKFSRN